MKISSRLRQVLLVITFMAVASSSGAEEFTKLDAKGNTLAADAANWAMVFDSDTGLYWEVKSTDESAHSNKSAYKFEEVEENFLAKLNAEKFGGFADWRLPATDELSVLKKKDQAQPQINQDFFPNTVPSRYWSVGWCGSKSAWQPESVKFGKESIKGMKYVRAVRGKSLE